MTEENKTTAEETAEEVKETEAAEDEVTEATPETQAGSEEVEETKEKKLFGKKKKDKKLLRQYLVTYIIVLICKNNIFSYGFLCQFFEI